MIPVTQTKAHIKNAAGQIMQAGNCYAAAIASLMDLPITEVPNVEIFFAMDENMWDEVMNAWLKWKGKTIRPAPEFCIFHPEVANSYMQKGWMDLASMATTESYRADMEKLYYCVSGISPRGVSHITIWKAGVMVWDPHPSRDGISLEEPYFQVLDNI